MKRIPQFCILAALALLAASCGGNSTLDDTEAAVVLTVDVTLYNPEIDICGAAGVDVTIAEMTVISNPKAPGTVLGTNNDVNITRWVITPSRSDGGTTASPEWVVDQGIFVPADGETELENWRVYPAEYFLELPLSNLLPENGGFDPETGHNNIRQTLRLQMFGRTVSGKAVSTVPVNIAFNFFCVSP
ncbi:MAG TPA: hypothetical protein PKJ99_16855 [Thermoanaerobaculales bacterium]|nr:hypothetical protein [Thermoanaerobaculales bacterium]HQL30067.1 hypothetical protein [Thermoanaerobaculales bacterium]